MHCISFAVQLALALFLTLASGAPPADHPLNIRASYPTGTAVYSPYTGPTYIPTGSVTVLVDVYNKTAPKTGSMVSVGTGLLKNLGTAVTTGVYATGSIPAVPLRRRF